MRSYLILILSFLPSLGITQNLVSNPSFGNKSCCPFTVIPGSLNCSVGWQAAQCSPDFFHACGSPSLNVPNNSWGYQNGISDSAYAGFYSYGFPGAGNPNANRDYISTILLDTLKPGCSYKFTAHLSLSDFSVFVHKRLGALFTNYVINNGNSCQYIPIEPQIYFDYHVTDTLNWVELTDTFIATGGEYFMSIGNFFPDSLIDTIKVRPNGVLGTYYYIDNVSLVELPLSIGEHRRFDMELLPNPSQGLFTLRKLPVALKRVKLSILSAEGRIIEEELLDVHNRSVTFQSKAPPGFYMLRITDADGEKGFGLKKVIIQ